MLARWAAEPMTGCWTPIQNRTPPEEPSGERRARMGVMKSRFPNWVPSLRKFWTNVNDSCCASSACDMCACAAIWKARSASWVAVSASRVSEPGGSSRKALDCRNRQLTWRTSCGAHPHIAPKPDEAKTIGLRSCGLAGAAEGSVTSRLRSESRRKSPRAAQRDTARAARRRGRRRGLPTLRIGPSRGPCCADCGWLHRARPPEGRGARGERLRRAGSLCCAWGPHSPGAAVRRLAVGMH
eukprot:scaffold239603_cov30-Tisochrysis_lutea.AAC.2